MILRDAFPPSDSPSSVKKTCHSPPFIYFIMHVCELHCLRSLHPSVWHIINKEGERTFKLARRVEVVLSFMSTSISLKNSYPISCLLACLLSGSGSHKGDLEKSVGCGMRDTGYGVRGTGCGISSTEYQVPSTGYGVHKEGPKPLLQHGNPQAPSSPCAWNRDSRDDFLSYLLHLAPEFFTHTNHGT